MEWKIPKKYWSQNSKVSQQIASEESVTLKTKRSVVKRKITIHLKALGSEIGQFFSKVGVHYFGPIKSSIRVSKKKAMDVSLLV